MGYNTYYSGQLDITPPLTKPELVRFAQVVDFWNSDQIVAAAQADVFEPYYVPLTKQDEATQPHPKPPVATFNLRPDSITDINDRAKGYENETALTVAALWLTKNGHKLDGDIAWEGDDSEDTGTIFAAFVEDASENRVEFVDDEPRTNRGPSWRKEATNGSTQMTEQEQAHNSTEPQVLGVQEHKAGD